MSAYHSLIATKGARLASEGYCAVVQLRRAGGISPVSNTLLVTCNKLCQCASHSLIQVGNSVLSVQGSCLFIYIFSLENLFAIKTKIFGTVCL
jgi:hypothetical protein